MNTFERKFSAFFNPNDGFYTHRYSLLSVFYIKFIHTWFFSYFAPMNKPIAQKRQAALGFIFATLLIDVMGLGIIIPVIPKLIEHLIHGDVSDASGYAGWLTAAYAGMQFLFAPLIGNLSDK